MGQNISGRLWNGAERLLPSPHTAFDRLVQTAQLTTSLPPNGCERRPQTQMASKRVCRRPATSSLRRWLRAKNFCLVSCGANQIKTNQLEAIAPILLTDFFFRADCAQCTSRRVQGAASSNLQAMCEWDAIFR